MSKAKDIILAAWENVGIPNPTSNQYSKGLRRLNNIIKLWSVEGLLVPANTVETFNLIASQSAYTIGDTGDFNTVRPVKIDYAFIRDANGQDHRLEMIQEREYQSIWLKTVSNRPYYLYLDTTYPLSTINLFPTPNAVEVLHISSWKPLTSFATINTTVGLPGEYDVALEHELTRALAVGIGWSPDVNFLDLARNSKAAIMSLVASRIPDAEYDFELTTNYRNNRYDAKRG